MFERNLIGAIIILGLGFLLLVAVLAPLFLRMKERTHLYDLIRRAQDLGQPLAPEILREILAASKPTREKDIRRGVILLALAVALGLSQAGGIADDGIEGLSFLLLPVFVLLCLGLAFLGLGLSRRSSKD